MEWTDRYQHDLVLTIRVWPRTPLTVKRGLEEKEFPINGMTINKNENLEACHSFNQRGFLAWEMSQEDAYKLSAAGGAGAKFGKMVVRTPGSKFNTVKKECWLEVPLTIYPKAWRRSGELDPIMRGTEDEIAEQVKRVWAQDIERAKDWAQKELGYTPKEREIWTEDLPREFTGVHYVMNPELADLNTLAEQVMKGKAILVDTRLRNVVSIDEIDRALEYWVVPGKKPDEPGGAFMGYCLGRSVFWCENADIPEWMRGDGPEAVADYRSQERREKRLGKIKAKFVEQVTEGVARHYGINRERVARRFIEEGFMDWIIEEAEKTANDRHREETFPGLDALCKGPASEACKVIAFCIDSMAIRPPEPPPPMVDLKRQKQREEYQRKKIDAFNALPPEEQEKILAKRNHRQRNRPERVARRIVEAYAASEGRAGEVDAIVEELTLNGVFGLILNGLKTRKDTINGSHFMDAQAAMLVHIGAKAVGLLKAYRLGEACDERGIGTGLA